MAACRLRVPELNCCRRRGRGRRDRTGQRSAESRDVGVAGATRDERELAHIEIERVKHDALLPKRPDIEFGFGASHLQKIGHRERRWI